ncbi:MAG: NFACT family protein [Chrysiogenetes bacterium]|nr:NFACT family protein [Chrysiogenetes bacterium]
MSLSAPEIERVLDEIAPICRGSFLNRIRLHRGRDLLLDLRNGPERPTLLISMEPEASRLGFVTRPGGTGEDPGGFLQLLRARMEGLRLAEIAQPGGDRIVRIDCAGKSAGRRPPATLLAEIMGARSNLYVLDDEGRVEGALRRGGFRPGEMWAPPEGGGDAPPEARDFADVEGASYCERIENFYNREIPRRAEEKQRAQVSAALRRERGKLRRLEKNLRRDIERAGDPEEQRTMGQLLKANARQIPPEASEVKLPRWDRPDELITIALKPSENAGVNADRYFERARRAQRTQAAAQKRIDETAWRIAEIETLLELAGELPVTELLAEAGRLKISTGTQRERQVSEVGETHGSAAMEKLFEKLKIKPRRFTSETGQLILVGRNSKENDVLTTKVARPHDYFFHVSGAPGSHVIACVNKGEKLDPATVRRAAELALRYSAMAKSGRGDISYCERRYVRKRKGDPPGLVHLMGRHETLWIELGD